LGHPKPPCDLLILQGVTLAYKGLAPSGKITPVVLERVCTAHAGHTHEACNHAGRASWTGKFKLETASLRDSNWKPARIASPERYKQGVEEYPFNKMDFEKY